MAKNLPNLMKNDKLTDLRSSIKSNPAPPHTHTHKAKLDKNYQRAS